MYVASYREGEEASIGIKRAGGSLVAICGFRNMLQLNSDLLLDWTWTVTRVGQFHCDMCWVIDGS